MRKDLFINPTGEESKGTKLIPGLWIRTDNSTPRSTAKERREMIDKGEYQDWTSPKTNVQNCCKIQNYL
jgi:hypothetical protein